LALAIEEKVRGLTCLVGNTPLLAIEARFRGSSRLIYAKCEQLNLTGSIKDRIALYILSKAYSTRLLKRPVATQEYPFRRLEQPSDIR
jgi:cysteine synthase A